MSFAEGQVRWSLELTAPPSHDGKPGHGVSERSGRHRNQWGGAREATRSGKGPHGEERKQRSERLAGYQSDRASMLPLEGRRLCDRPDAKAVGVVGSVGEQALRLAAGCEPRRCDDVVTLSFAAFVGQRQTEGIHDQVDPGRDSRSAALSAEAQESAEHIERSSTRR